MKKKRVLIIILIIAMSLAVIGIATALGVNAHVKNVGEKNILSPEEAEELLKECGILKDALPVEGKMMVRRYSGPVERMEAVARVSISEGCGFYFF